MRNYLYVLSGSIIIILGNRAIAHDFVGQNNFNYIMQMENQVDTSSIDSLFTEFEIILEKKAPQIKDSFVTGLKSEYIKNTLLNEK